MHKKNQPKAKPNTSFPENNKLFPNTIKQGKLKEDNIFTKDLTSNTKTFNDIIDIDDSPDVATWNKEVTRYKDHTKDSIISEEMNKKYTNSPKIPPTTTIGLRKENNDNEDDQVDPANQQDLNEIFNSGGKLTDQANLFNSKRKLPKN